MRDAFAKELRKDRQAEIAYSAAGGDGREIDREIAADRTGAQRGKLHRGRRERHQEHGPEQAAPFKIAFHFVEVLGETEPFDHWQDDRVLEPETDEIEQRGPRETADPD